MGNTTRTPAAPKKVKPEPLSPSALNQLRNDQYTNSNELYKLASNVRTYVQNGQFSLAEPVLVKVAKMVDEMRAASTVLAKPEPAIPHDNPKPTTDE